MFGARAPYGAYGISYTTAPLGRLGQAVQPAGPGTWIGWAAGLAAGVGTAWYLTRGGKPGRRAGAIAAAMLLPGVGFIIGQRVDHVMT